jgi:ribonuclease D
LFEDTPLILVNDRETLEAAAKALGAAKAIGVDTESDSFHHYQEKVCLLQFSDMEHDYVVDPLALGMDLSPLAAVLADPNVCKIFHGADYDIVCLKRDFKVEIHNVFDTMISAQQLGLGGVGLADLVCEFFGIELEKKYQRHDWAERPLLPEHIEYARGDTHWLIALREILMRRLSRAGRLHRVLEECRLLENREWEGRTFDPDGYLRIKTQGVTLDDQGKRILRRLWLYRDEQARKLDRPPFKVIPDPVLVEVALARPQDEGALEKLFPRAKSAMKRRHAAGFLDAVVNGLTDDFPIPRAGGRGPRRADREPSTPARLTGRSAERAMNALKEWRNDLVSKTPNLNPVAVVSNNTLKSIVRARPESLEELATVPDVRNWQVDAYGAQILAVLDHTVPKGSVPEEGDGVEESDGAGGGGRRRRRRRRGGRSSGGGATA